VVKVPKPDLSDGVAVAGLIAASVGLWMLSPWAVLVFVGLLTAVLALRLGS